MNEEQPWAVRDGGLAWRSDWMSVQWLTDALNGTEEEDRIPESDVEALLSIIETGIAVGPAVRRARSYRECPECGLDWYEPEPERHAPACNLAPSGRSPEHTGRLVDSGPEYGEVWECDANCDPCAVVGDIDPPPYEKGCDVPGCDLC